MSVAGTFRLRAVELRAETMRPENRKLLGLPLTSASRSQHRRSAPAIAPGAAMTRSVLGTDTHTLGITPGARLVAATVITNPTARPGTATGSIGTIRTLAALLAGVTVAAVRAKSLA